jgi:hypothetical protein
MQIHEAFSKFETIHTPKLHSPPAEGLNGALEGTSGERGCESRATGPATEAEYLERLAGSRRLGYTLLVAALVAYAVWAWWPL